MKKVPTRELCAAGEQAIGRALAMDNTCLWGPRPFFMGSFVTFHHKRAFDMGGPKYYA